MGGAPVTKNFRGADVDLATYAFLEELASLSGSLYIDPIDGYGSYRNNAASAGTDTGAGHVDLNGEKWTDTECRSIETLARSLGALAYFRPRINPYTGNAYGWQKHIHILVRGIPGLSDAALAQISGYVAGTDGLSPARKDTGNRSYVDMTWPKYLAQKDEIDMATADELLAAINALPKKVWDYSLPNHDPDPKDNVPPVNYKASAYLIMGNWRTSEIQKMLVAELGTGNITVQDIVDAIPDNIAEQVVAKLAARMQS